MSNSNKPRFKPALNKDDFKSVLAGTIAKSRLDMFGQFMPIGAATCALLQKGDAVTIPALINEIEAAGRSALTDRSIMHLKHLVDDPVDRQ